jgi:receptor protein-tyrosine kinase
VAVAPKPRRDAAIGALLGLLLGAVLAVLFHALDKRLRSVDSVENIFSRPVVGAIPQSRALATNEPLGPADVEAFRMLRANLRYYNSDRRVRSVLVTSSTIGEGKSTVAWHLAAAGAGAGASVLLIEADLRAPVLARRFGVEAPLGLRDVLLGEAKPADVVHRVDVSVSDHGPKSGMGVMFAGSPPANPVDLIESKQMADLLAQASEEFDMVVVDAPPMSVVPDAIPLIRRVDGVLVVSRLGTTSKEGAEHMRDQLENLKARPLGIVVNGVSRHDGRYGSVYQAAERYAEASSKASSEASSKIAARV